MPPGSKSRYIPALDGLRAFAVIVVIFYHLGFDWAPGGLLGVTVFFVLSGYLITSLLLGEWQRTRTIKLKDFWLRRIKRLVPAIVFVLVAMAALYTVFNHELLTKMRPDIPPVLFFFSNWWFIFHDMSYFDALGAPSPLTHFWSLAIEEQFYLIWPVLLLGLFKTGAKKSTATKITAVLMGISVLLMAFLYDPNLDPSRVYYGTDTRAFSLLIGALLAFIWPSNQLSEASDLNLSKRGRLIFDGVGIAAFVGLILLVAFANGFSPFMYRGGIFLASIFTAIVIAVLIHPKSFFAKLASFKPFVWVGERSYGIYLWHYPLILLIMGRIGGDNNPLLALVVIALIVAVSDFSYRFIENPVRKGGIGRFVKDLRAGAISLADYVRTHIIPVVLAAALTLVAFGGLIFVPKASVVENVDALILPSDRDYPIPGVHAYQSRISAALEAENHETFDILLIGDSVSVRAIPYFEKTFPNGAIDSQVNRALYDAASVYTHYRDLGLVGNTVVFAVGTNGWATDEQLDELIGAVGTDKQIYLINTRSPQEWMQTTNEALQRASERYENVSLIDWYNASAGHEDNTEIDYFDGDNTHLNELGAEAYVEMVRVATGFPVPQEPIEYATEELAEYSKKIPIAARNSLLVSAGILSSILVAHPGS